MAPDDPPECGANFDTDVELAAHRKLTHTGPARGVAVKHPGLETEMEWEGGPSPNRLNGAEDTRREAPGGTAGSPEETDPPAAPGHPPRRGSRRGGPGWEELRPLPLTWGRSVDG